MKGDEVLVMTSLVIIFAVFLQRRRSFIQQMRLMSLQMRKMRRNLLILSIQQRNNIQCHTFQVYLPSHDSLLCNGDVTPRMQNIPLCSLDNKELMRFADLSGHQLPMISSV